MLRPILADLHVHTVLSPCAEVEMIPPLIVERALNLGLSLIAITDHNAAGNARAVIEAAADTPLTVLAGMELETREGVHLLCLFEDADRAEAWQEEIWQRLPPLKNKPEFFGEQFVVDAEGDWLATEERLLSAAAAITLNEAIAGLHELEGLAIPAHADRPMYGLLETLGMVPEGLAADAMEVTGRFDPRLGLLRWPTLMKWPLLVGSDAHRLNEMTDRTLIKVAAPTIEEIKLALMGEDGRKIEVDWPGAPEMTD